MTSIEFFKEDNSKYKSTKKEISTIESGTISIKKNHPRPETLEEEKYSMSSKRLKLSSNFKTTAKKSYEVKFKEEVEEIKDYISSSALRNDNQLQQTPKVIHPNYSPNQKLLKSVKEHIKTPYSKMKEFEDSEDDKSVDESKKKKNEKLFSISKKHYFTNNSTSKENPFFVTETKVYNLRQGDIEDCALKNEELDKTIKSKNLKGEEDVDDQINKDKSMIINSQKESKGELSSLDCKNSEDADKIEFNLKKFKDDSKK